SRAWSSDVGSSDLPRAAGEPLEFGVGGGPPAVPMRPPGSDVELAAGFLVAEGVIARGDQVRSAIHCGGPSTGSGIATGSGSATGSGRATGSGIATGSGSATG